MLGQARIKQITDTILARSSADQTEVLMLVGDQALTRFANSTIHQNVYETDATVRIRVVLGKRIVVAELPQWIAWEDSWNPCKPFPCTRN